MFGEKTRKSIESLQSVRKRQERRECECSLEKFVKASWTVLEPGKPLSWNWSLTMMCEFLEAFARRDFHRGIINVPPRCSKSTIVSVCFNAWVWCQPDGKGPGRMGASHQFMCLSNDESLSLRDAVATRNLIDSEWYQGLWGVRVRFADDQNEKKFYKNLANGHRVSKGLRGAIIGKGGDTILIDDPHDVDDVMSDATRDGDLQSYDGKVISRLNDQSAGGIMIIMQRLADLDLVGHVIKKDGLYSDDNPLGWVKLSLPMEFELDERGKEPINPAEDLGYIDPRTKAGDLLWPHRFPRASVEHLASGLGEYQASGQLQQRPSPGEGGILKKAWWRYWPDDKPFPVTDHIFLSWDTAYSEQDLKKNAFSAMTMWGVWWDEQDQRHKLIMLYAWDAQVAYPELRKRAKVMDNEFHPDRHLIEKKASGQALLPDLRRAGIAVYPYQPDRDKVARAYAIQSPLKGGLIYAPNREWAMRVIDYCAAFPVGAPPSADYTDTVTQAVLYLTNRWWVTHPDDGEEAKPTKRKTQRVPAYG